MAKSVSIARLNRYLDALKARGDSPCAIDLLPDGSIRAHLVPPANDAGEDQGPNEWDAALR